MKARQLIYFINLMVILSFLWVAWPSALEGASATPTPTPTPTISSSITLYPASGTVGQTIQISGTGFTRNGSVAAVLLGSTNVTVDSTVISDEGLSTYFLVPSLPKPCIPSPSIPTPVKAPAPLSAYSPV